jgi:superfamily I DNA and RNA helicase
MDRLFADVIHPRLLSEAIDKVKEYANRVGVDIYMMTYPKSDLSELEKTTCFFLMSSGYKIAVVNNNKSENEFEEYVDDVRETIFYLYQKYGYRSELGRYQQWSEGLFDEKTINDIDDMDDFWQSIKLHDSKDIRNSQLLISLCTGSINDISKVKGTLPQNLLDRVKQRIQLFDADQTRFIYQDLSKKVIKIQGLSGTGKTELLLHKLKGLYLDKEDSRIFITCHNKILADSLHNRIPRFFDFMKVTQQIEWNKRLWCSNAWGSSSNLHSGLYRYICSYYQIPFHSYSKSFTFDMACKEAIEHIKSKKNNGKFTHALDYVLIDECQDFKPSFIELCKLVTEKKVYLAGDIFQSIFSDFDQNDYEADYFLSKCYRTDPKTLMIAQALGLGLFEDIRLRWLTEDNWKACGYTYNDAGNSIELSRIPIKRFSDEDLEIKSFYLKKFVSDNPIGQVIEIIKTIRNDYPNVQPNDISVIMLDDNSDIYEWANQLERRLYTTFQWEANKAYETKSVDTNKLLISNRNNVKGLEYPFVICVTRGIGSSYGYRNALYTMLSRSFLVSYLLVSGNEKNGITPSMVDGMREIMDNHRMTVRKPTDDEKKIIETRFTKAQSEILKPFDEKLSDIMTQLNISKNNRAQLQKMVMSTNLHWEDLSDEDLKAKVQLLNMAL